MGKHHKTYHIHCGKCGAYLLTYHKYGAGKGILRLYFDHIVAPDTLVNQLQSSDYQRINDVPNLTCTDCQQVLGVPALSKSKKWVYRMRQGFFHRKLQK